MKNEIYGGNTMLENIPSQSTMTELLGQSLYEVWQELCSVIEEKYEMDLPCADHCIGFHLKAYPINRDENGKPLPNKERPKD